MLTLKEKIEKSKSCVHCRTSGKCALDGYAPFDCENCSSFSFKSDGHYVKQVKNVAEKILKELETE